MGKCAWAAGAGRQDKATSVAGQIAEQVLWDGNWPRTGAGSRLAGGWKPGRKVS